MQQIFLVLSTLLAIASAGVCDDRMKSAPQIKVVAGFDQNYNTRCLACQGGNKKTSADVAKDPCEYCSGMCLDVKLFGEGNPLSCYVKRGLSKRSDCDGVNEFGTSIRGFTDATVGPTTTDKPFVDASGNTFSGHNTITHKEETFPEDTTAGGPTTDPNYNGGNNTPPQGTLKTMTTPKSTTTVKPGAAGSVCDKGPPVKYYDRCGKCGGNGACSDASATQLSVLLATIIALLSLL